MSGVSNEPSTAEQTAIASVVAALGIRRGYLVEFGAWDGVRLSNSRALIAHGWTGVLIEADAEQFTALRRNVTAPGVRLLHCRVEAAGDDSLDAILTREACPPQFDLLSIDVDSDDLAIWMSLRSYRPRIVVIEYNVTIPFDVEFINPPSRHWGNSALSIHRHAEAANYGLVAIAGMSLVYVERSACAAAGLDVIALDRRHATMAPRYFWGYDGTLLTSDREDPAPEIPRVPWHRFRFAQPMPRPLRRWDLARRRRRREWVVSLLLLLPRPFAVARWLKRRPRAR
jgi:hypothetical protein